MDTWMLTLALVTPALAVAALTLAWRGLHLAKVGRAEVAALHEHLQAEVREQVLAALEERHPAPATTPRPTVATEPKEPREDEEKSRPKVTTPADAGPSEEVRRRALEIARTAWETAQYLGLEHLAGREPNVYKLSLPCGSGTDREALAHLGAGALPCVRSASVDPRKKASTLVIDLGAAPPPALHGAPRPQ